MFFFPVWQPCTHTHPPAGGRPDSPGRPVQDKDNFVLLLRDLRAAFDLAEAAGRAQGRLLLTAAVSAGKDYIDRVNISNNNQKKKSRKIIANFLKKPQNKRVVKIAKKLKKNNARQ